MQRRREDRLPSLRYAHPPMSNGARERRLRTWNIFGLCENKILLL